MIKPFGYLVTHEKKQPEFLYSLEGHIFGENYQITRLYDCTSMEAFTDGWNAHAAMIAERDKGGEQ